MKPYHDNFMTPALNKQMKRTVNQQEVVIIRRLTFPNQYTTCFIFLKKVYVHT